MSHGYPLLLVHHYFDNNGDNAAFHRLYTYEAGTSTPKDTFLDEALTIPNTNPIVLDAQGRCTIFVCAGEGYKIILKHPTLNIELWTRDYWAVPGVTAVATPAEVPVGGIIMYGGAVAPTGWLLCDGTAVNRVTYAALFAILDAAGLPFGPGDGATTFNVPDFRQRFPMGVAASGVGNALGDTAGAIDHVHTGPSHTHTVSAHTHTMVHTHTVPRNGWGGVQVVGAGTAGRLLANDGIAINLTEAQNDNATSAQSTNTTGSTALTTDAEGTGNTGAANPPLLAVHFIIRAD